jgi:hypothetical protein
MPVFLTLVSSVAEQMGVVRANLTVVALGCEEGKVLLVDMCCHKADLQIALSAEHRLSIFTFFAAVAPLSMTYYHF